MCVSGDGKFVVTGAHDKSLRIWERTNEPLVLEDERETEKEEQYENELPKEEFVIAGETNKETGLATIKTIETIKAVKNYLSLSLSFSFKEENSYLRETNVKKNKYFYIKGRENDRIVEHLP